MDHRAVPDLKVLLSRLRHEDGLPLGIDRLASAEILVNRRLAQAPLDDPVAVADLLAPLLATSPAEQEAVRRRVFELQPDPDLAIERSVEGGRAVPIEFREVADERQRTIASVTAGNRARTSWRIALAVVLAVLAVVLAMVVLDIRPEPPPGPKGERIPLEQLTPVIGALPSGLEDPRLVAGSLAALIVFLALRRLRPDRIPPRPPPNRSRIERAWETPDADRSQLLPPSRLRGALRGMRSALLPESRQVDLLASIKATARSGGLPHLVNARAAPVPAYLLFADIRDRRDQSGLLPEILVRRLRGALLRLDAYVVGAHPGMARPWDQRQAPSVSIGQLTPLRAGSRLLLVSDGTPWWEPLSDTLSADAKAFVALSPRILLTPVPRTAWGAREACFRRAGFAVLELTPGGLDSLARWLESPGENAPPASAPTRFRDIADELERQSTTLMQERPPPPGRQDLLRDQLMIWLGADGWQLLAAVALHPRPGAGLTARLAARLSREPLPGQVPPADETSAGAASPPGELRGPAGRRPRLMRLDEATVSRVTRLPWLRRGRMPLWVRRMLTAGLDMDLHPAVADVYLRFLAGEDGAPFRNDPVERAALLQRARSGPSTGVTAPDGVLSEFLAGQVAPPAPPPTIWARGRVWMGSAVLTLGAAAVGLLTAILWPYLDAAVVVGVPATGSPAWLPIPLAIIAMGGLWFANPARIIDRVAPLLVAVVACMLLTQADQLANAWRVAGVGAVIAAASLLVARERRVNGIWDPSGGHPLSSAVVVAGVAGIWIFGLHRIFENAVTSANMVATEVEGITFCLAVAAAAAGRAGLLPSGATPATHWRLGCLFVGGGLISLGLGLLAVDLMNPGAARLMPLGDTVIMGAVLMTGMAWKIPLRSAGVLCGIGLVGATFAYLPPPISGGFGWISMLILALPFRLALVGSPRRLVSPLGVFCGVLKGLAGAMLILLLGDRDWEIPAIGCLTLSVALEYFVVARSNAAPQAADTWRIGRSWLEAAPLLLCTLSLSLAPQILFSLPLLALPVAALLGARHGRAALAPVALMLAPMLIPVSLGPSYFAGTTGLWLTALLTARVAGDATLRRAVLAADVPPSTLRLMAVLFLLPWYMSISSGLLQPTLDLWFLLMALLLAIGMGRAPLRTVTRWIVGVWAAGVVLRALGFPLSFGPIRIGFNFSSPADLLTALMVLHGPRILRGSGPMSFRGLTERSGQLLLVFFIATLLARVRLAPAGIESLLGSIGPIGFVTDTTVALFALVVAAAMPARWWLVPAVFALARLPLGFALPQSITILWLQILSGGWFAGLCQTAVIAGFARLGVAMARQTGSAPGRVGTEVFAAVLSAARVEAWGGIRIAAGGFVLMTAVLYAVLLKMDGTLFPVKREPPPVSVSPSTNAPPTATDSPNGSATRKTTN